MEYKKILNFNRYCVYKDSTIKNIQTCRIIKHQLNINSGYTSVNLTDDNNQIKRFLVHKIVASAFLPNPLNKQQINHKDGNKLNNHISNLEGVIPKENMNHAIKSNLLTCTKHKLNISKVKIIKTLLKYNVISITKISQKFKVSRRLIRMIKYNEVWKNVKI